MLKLVMKNVHHNLPEVKVTYSDDSFCGTKAQGYSDYFPKRQREAKNLHIWETETREYI